MNTPQIRLHPAFNQQNPLKTANTSKNQPVWLVNFLKTPQQSIILALKLSFSAPC